MNKKDVANFRKQFKLNNDRLRIKDIFHVYVMKETSDIFHQESQPFQMLDKEEQELYMMNFKKILTGQMDVKLFELTFLADKEDHSKEILYNGLRSDDVDDWKEEMLLLVYKMLKDNQYPMDIVITFIRGEYYKPVKKNGEDDDQESVFHHPFILCTINKTEQPESTLLFDYVEKEFKYNVIVDPVIDLNKPIGGFLYPTFTDQGSDVNHILYSVGKSKEIDFHLIEDVLNAELGTTAEEDKAVFEEIVKEVAGEEIDPSTLANVYEEIHQVIVDNEEDEPAKLDKTDVERVLKVSGIEEINKEKVEFAFKKVVEDENYELKASNIVPSFTSKSIKINTKVANISISPQDLKYVKQIVFNGKRCLLIEVDEETVVDGFKMIPEAFL